MKILPNFKLVFLILTLFFGTSSCDFISLDTQPMQEVLEDTFTPINQQAESSTDIEISEIEKDVFEKINAYRQTQNLPPLQLNTDINQEAKIHSQDMADGKVPFSHQGFDDRAKSISTVITSRSVAENLAYNLGYADPAENAVSGWLDSPGHYKNIVGEFNLTGVGVVRNDKGEYYLTQIFVLEGWQPF